MAGTSEIRDDFGNPLTPFMEENPKETINEKIIVDWGDIVEDDQPIEDDGYELESEEDGSPESGSDEEDDTDYQDDGSEGAEDIKGEDNEKIDIITYNKINRSTLESETGERACFCMDPLDNISALSLLNDIIFHDVDIDNQSCLISNITRCLNKVFSSTKKVIEPKKLAATDLFFKCRHEILFKLLCKSYDLPSGQSDIPFSNYGIDSKRTPDLLIMTGGILAIIEVTASSNFERAAQSKGIESAGFESKYKKEMDLLSDRGISNVYVPIVFNMASTSGEISLKQFSFLDNNFHKNKIYFQLMVTVSKNLAIISNEMKNNMIVSSSILFSNIVEIELNHPQHAFLYNISSEKLPKCNTYKELNISSQVYTKVNSNWQRLHNVLDNSNFSDNTKIIFCLNTGTHRFHIEKNFELGLTIKEFENIIESNDKLEFFKNLFLIVGGVRMRSVESDSGLKFYEKQVSKDLESVKFQQIKPFVDHEPMNYLNQQFDIIKYNLLARKSVDYNLISNHYDEKYEEKLIESICKMDSETDYLDDDEAFKGLLGCMETNKINIDASFEDIKVAYINGNVQTEILPIIINKMKQPFILPISEIFESDYAALDVKPIELIVSAIKNLSGSNPFTTKILENVLSDNFNLFVKPKLASSTLRGLISKRMEISNRINYLQKELYKKGSNDNVTKLSKTNDPSYSIGFLKMKEEIRAINKEINIRQKFEGVKNETSFIRLPTKNKGSTLRGLYDKEMQHFKDKKKQSTIEGVGIRTTLENDFEFDKNIFNNLCESLVVNHGENPDQLLDMNVTEDAKLLTDLKKMALEQYKSLVNQVKNSALGHSSALVSRMAHSLLYYSQLPFNSDYIRVDNLGYNNVLLIVRGGKKIFKSKSSKLFRLIYPIEKSTLPWFTTGHVQQSSTFLFNIEERNYAVTPWQMLNESILCESISFYPRICSFVVLNSNPEIDLKSQFPRVSLNVLLAFHNRRQTEVLLANLRYILLSTLGDFTGMMEIIKDFFGFNYDCFQAFIRGCILFNYPSYFKQLENLKGIKKVNSQKEVTLGDFLHVRLKNIFTGLSLKSTEELALMIYSTFLMTKAPYQRSVERANNLKGILNIHDQYKKNVGYNLDPVDQLKEISVVLTGDYKSYAKQLFGNDFNIDPKYCALVGNFIDSIYRNQGDVEDLHSSWLRIINKTWDELSTSTGLRGEYDEIENFWGKKGYFVVYKKLLDDMKFRQKADALMNSGLQDDEKRKKLKDINITYYEKINPEREFLIFHAVDKVQWRGGREIYVMDLLTKTMQQPIEQFMGELCKKLDNELISIPSDKRSQVIHHSIFEKDLPVKNLLTWYLTLDCTKWAPKSVFVKFAITILNMSCIPTSFKVHFLNYIEKLYYKRVYFNQQEVTVLMNNNKYEEICKKYLIYDVNVKGYYLEMQYSWVMGIFNYTSSFLHAANQKYFSYLLMKTSLISYKEESNMVMFAHSDDSGGRLTVSNFVMAKRALILYEINLKACNHLLSKKKSVISRIYFEILSIIYLFKQLLALLPKFLGGLRFMPTDKGPAQDMLQSYSKSIEVMVSGANFNVAYLVMKFYSMIIWRFYYNRPVTKTDYNRPVQYLGMPDAHPLLVLLCGSDAELLRLLKNKENLSTLIVFVQTMLSTTKESGPIKPLGFEIKVRGIGKGFEDGLESYKELIESWSVRNVNYHNSFFNLLSFLSKLNNSGFVGSLVNESTTRRLSRCYFMRSGNSCITRFGGLKLMQVLDSLTLLQSYTDKLAGTKAILDQVMDETSIYEIDKELKEKLPNALNQIKILEKTLYSPLKINKYMENLTLEGRKITVATRTLKPTVLQLTKTAKVFSVDFDPSTLVSFIKEPELNWAISDTRGLITASLELQGFCNEIGLNMEEVEADDLLRICRTYGKENTKMIYLYSRVPSELRQIKSYSAFLTFLSVNTFDNKEIEGLTLKLSGRDAVRDYVETNINPEIYLINNIISTLNVFINKVDNDFLLNCTINDIDEIQWTKGKFIDFIKHLDEFFSEDVHYSILKPQIKFIMSKVRLCEINSTIIKGGAFYTFLKSQKIKGGWYGKGEIMIVIDNNFYSFTLMNTEIETVQTNKTGRLPTHHSNFIKDVFNHTNINYNSIIRGKKPISLHRKIYFGHDTLGNLSVLGDREIQTGIPCFITENRGGFIDEMHLYNMKEMFKDHILLKNDVFETEQKKKIYFLPIKKAEIIPIIKQMFLKEEFESKMMEGGLNDFEDFLLTEIMTEYGCNNYIGFEEFLDGFTGSKLYEVFKECRDKNLSHIPKGITQSIIPAPEGSLTRILIDYTIKTSDKILETPQNLDPVIMQLRSEYPEQMSVILSDNLIKYHDKIYSKSEMKEISDSYSKLYESNNQEVVRNNLIKLLTFWGYGSLVNSLEKFTLTRGNKNYIYFNKNICSPNYITHYEGVFPKLLTCFNKILLEWASYIRQGDFLFKFLINKTTTVHEIIRDYVMDTCLSIYNYSVFEAELSLPTMRYFNLLTAFLKEDEFVASVQFEMNKHYILGSIPINYQNRKNIFVLINNLKDCWLKFNKEKMNLKFTEKLQRLPDNTKNYRQFIKLMGIDLPPSEIYYHGFLNLKILGDLKQAVEITSGKTIYRVTSKLSDLSDVKVVANDIIKFKLPLKESILGSEDYEELDCELGMQDKDVDTIIELWDVLNSPYKQKTTKIMNVKGNRLIRGTINWIVRPYCSCTFPEINYIRQIGENIVYLSNIYIKNFKECFPNSGVRIVNYDKGKIMLAHYTFVNEFKKDFIDKYIGGTEFNFPLNLSDELMVSSLRDSDGEVKNSLELGCKNILEETKTTTQYREVDGIIIPVDISNEQKIKEGDLKELDEDEIKYQELNEGIESLKNKGLSSKSLGKLKEKYMVRAFKNKIPFKIIMSSLIREGDLNLINEEILGNKFDLSSSQQKSAFLSPEYFGLAYGMNKISDPKSIKNSKIRAELESFHRELSTGIGSCTLNISHSFKRTVTSNIQLWKNTIKTTKNKRENKMFLFTLFLSIFNSSKLGDDTSDDSIWQDMINKSTNYIAEEITDEDDEEFLTMMFDFVAATRLKYRPEGL